MYVISFQASSPVALPGGYGREIRDMTSKSDITCVMKYSVYCETQRKGHEMTDSQSNIVPPVREDPQGGRNSITRRDALKVVLASSGAAAFAGGGPEVPPLLSGESKKGGGDPRKGSPKRYDMKKSINLWAFPYPERMNLQECLQLAKDAGFDAVELNYDLENDLSPKAGADECRAIRRLADKIGIRISGLCSFLF